MLFRSIPSQHGTLIDVDTDVAFLAESSATLSSISSVCSSGPELLALPNKELIFKDPSTFQSLSPCSTLSILHAKGNIIPHPDLLTITKSLAHMASEQSENYEADLTTLKELLPYAEEGPTKRRER